MMGSYAKHRCDQDGAPLGVLDGAAWAAPGEVVFLPDSGLYGRVRLLWRCCGAYLVQHLATDDAEAWEGLTYTIRAREAEMSRPPVGVMYSVPCVGASWSLHLPCGDIAGEGCDCDTIAAEAASV